MKNAANFILAYSVLTGDQFVLRFGQVERNAVVSANAEIMKTMNARMSRGSTRSGRCRAGMNRAGSDLRLDDFRRLSELYTSSGIAIDTAIGSS
jgi:hypothetical protein